MQKVCRTCQKVFGPSERICPEHQGYLKLHSLVGDVLRNRYEVTETLGEGYLALVCRGRDRELGYEVAVKALVEDPDSYRFYFNRFQREADAYAALSDPRFPRLFARGHLLDGRPYFVFEYVHGESLADLLRQEGRLLAPRAVRLACEIAAAMQEAHQQGFIHQDIKPGNILRYADATGTEQVKIIDFGIVRLVTCDEEETRRRSVGTPPYMSPEQWRREQLDRRTDVYSLGVTLYEMLTGAPPFSDDAWEDLRRRTLHDPVPPMREVVTGPHLPWQLPQGLEQLVLSMLAKDRANRPDSMLEVYLQLRALLKELEPDAVPYARYFSYFDGPFLDAEDKGVAANDDALAGLQDGLIAVVRPGAADDELPVGDDATPLRDLWSEADMPVPAEQVAEIVTGGSDSVVQALPVWDEPVWPRRAGASGAAQEVPADATRDTLRDVPVPEEEEAQEPSAPDTDPGRTVHLSLLGASHPSWPNPTPEAEPGTSRVSLSAEEVRRLRDGVRAQAPADPLGEEAALEAQASGFEGGPRDTEPVEAEVIPLHPPHAPAAFAARAALGQAPELHDDELHDAELCEAELVEPDAAPMPWTAARAEAERTPARQVPGGQPELHPHFGQLDIGLHEAATLPESELAQLLEPAEGARLSPSGELPMRELLVLDEEAAWASGPASAPARAADAPHAPQAPLPSPTVLCPASAPRDRSVAVAAMAATAAICCGLAVAYLASRYVTRGVFHAGSVASEAPRAAAADVAGVSPLGGPASGGLPAEASRVAVAPATPHDPEPEGSAPVVAPRYAEAPSTSAMAGGAGPASPSPAREAPREAPIAERPVPLEMPATASAAGPGARRPGHPPFGRALVGDHDSSPEAQGAPAPLPQPALAGAPASAPEPPAEPRVAAPHRAAGAPYGSTNGAASAPRPTAGQAPRPSQAQRTAADGSTARSSPPRPERAASATSSPSADDMSYFLEF